MDVNNQNGKSSAETAPSAHRTPKEQRPKKYSRFNKFSKGKQRWPTNQEKHQSVQIVHQSQVMSQNPSSNPKTTCTPTNNTETRNNKSRTPPSIEATTNP